MFWVVQFSEYLSVLKVRTLVGQVFVDVYVGCRLMVACGAVVVRVTVVVTK